MERPQKGQKTALVTGVGVGGIGGALATELHAAGYFVFCGVRRPEAIASLLKPGMVVVQLDVTESDSVTAALQQVSALTDGKLDVLINNAGLAIHRPALDLDIDTMAAPMLNTNVLGPMRMVNTFAGLLIEAKGCIVNIGSVSPIVPMAFSSGYNASKAALHSWSDTLRIELKPFDVQVVTVITGAVQSNIVRDKQPELPLGSRYSLVRDFWLRRVHASQEQAMDTNHYARKVVGMISKKKSKPIWFWSGGSMGLVWFVYYFLPKSVRFAIMLRRSGFHLLGK